MRNIDELINKPPPKREMTSEEISNAAHYAFLKELNDFTPNANRLRWPKPIGPRWKN